MDQQPLSFQDAFNEFVRGNVPDILIWPFVVNLLLTGLLCYLLGLIYVHFGRSLSNRATLARNFMAVGMTTMLIITIVKSSLALSLGLVGALSIVRFRTAIKEPEELAYLFLTISIGLGLGAGQQLVTALGFAAIVAVVCLKGLVGASADQSNLYLVVGSKGPKKARLEQLTSTLQAHCASLSLKRFDDSPESVEAAYHVVFNDYLQLESAKDALQALGESVSVSFIDNEGIT